MGNFAQHLTGSVVAGSACGVGSFYLFNAAPLDSLACATLCGLGGLIPDIDSPVSKPAEFVMSLSAALAPVFILQMLNLQTLDASHIFLIAVGVYLTARFVLRQVIKKFTFHRGIIHSIPAAIIWGCLVFLAYRHSSPLVQNLASASAVIGFVTHLLIDEMFSLVDISGGKLSSKASSGTALTLFGSSMIITIVTYLCVLILLYLCAVDCGQIKEYIFFELHP